MSIILALRNPIFQANALHVDISFSINIHGNLNNLCCLINDS